MKRHASTKNYAVSQLKLVERILLVSCFIFGISTSAFAQEYMMLKNGETITFTRYKIRETDVKVVTKDKGNLRLNFDEIIGYYNTLSGNTYYLKKGIPDGATENRYQFDKLILEGDINVFERVHFRNHRPQDKALISSYNQEGILAGSELSQPIYHNNTNIGTTSNTRFINQWLEIYLEKNNTYQGFDKFGIGRISKKDRKALLVPLIKDNEELVKQVEDEEFKCRNEDIIDIAKSYNLSKFKPLEKSNEVSSVYFYVKNRNMGIDSLKLYINEEFIDELPKSTALSANLDNKNLSKVCVNTYCEVLKASPYYIKHFEILVKKNEIKFTETEKIEAERYLLYLINTAK